MYFYFMQIPAAECLSNITAKKILKADFKNCLWYYSNATSQLKASDEQNTRRITESHSQ